MPPPQNIKGLRQLLGLAGYYRNQITHYADITHALMQLLEKDKLYARIEPYQKAFKDLKRLKTLASWHIQTQANCSFEVSWYSLEQYIWLYY